MSTLRNLIVLKVKNYNFIWKKHISKDMNTLSLYLVLMDRPPKTLKRPYRGTFVRIFLDFTTPTLCHAKIVESYGNKTDHYLNLICFQIHRDNAEHANRLNLKLHQKKKSSCDPIQTSLVNDQHCTDDNKDAQFIADMRAQYRTTTKISKETNHLVSLLHWQG